MSVAWGNPETHGEAFRKAFEEFKREHPDEHRRFHELEYELQRGIMARQVEIYNEAEGVRA
jgi:hypothetical protein